MALRREVRDVARSSIVEIKAKAKGGSAAGKVTSWELRPLEGNVPLQYVFQGVRGMVLTPQVEAKDASGWTGKLQLSHVGGDRHELTVTGPGGKRVEQVELVNTRTLPLVVYAHDPRLLEVWRAALPDIRKAFEPVFIELGVTEARSDRAGPGPLFRGTDKDASLAVDVRRLFDSGRLPPLKAPTLRVFLVDELVVRSDRKLFKNAAKLGDLIKYQDEGVTAEGAMPEDPVLSAKLTFKAGDVDITSRVSRDAQNDRLLRFSFDPDFLNRHFPGRAEVCNLVVRYEALAYGFSGWAQKNLIVVPRADPSGSDFDGPSLARVVIHEVGHALGQTLEGRTNVETGEFERSGQHYDQHQAAGDHCRTNGEPSGREARVEDRKIRRVAGAGKLCVMYNDALDADVDPTFCATCVLNLKLMHLAEGGALRQEWM